MAIPVPFQQVFQHWQSKWEIGFRDKMWRVNKADWTSSLHRYFGAEIEYRGGPAFVKLAIANQRDLDEPNMLDGLRREVWWSRIIEALRVRDPKFPFTSARVLETNVDQQPFVDEVAWVVFEYVDGAPIFDPGLKYSTPGTPLDDGLFDEFCDVAVRSLRALENVHPDTLDNLGVPELPAPPHGMRRWQRKGKLDMRTAILGNGAFEVENFWRGADGQLFILDNEFAGWYPPGDHLAYLYHRLYCKHMRPDLAKHLLERWLDQVYSSRTCVWEPEELRQLRRMLWPRVVGGFFLDMAPRRQKKSWPWHPRQRLRYRLLWELLCRKW